MNTAPLLRRLRFHGTQLHRILLLVACAVPASAVTITVNTTADELHIPAGASVSLREALRDAAFIAGVDTIVFAPALNGATVTVNSALSLTDTTGVIVDASALSNGITLNGGAGNNRVFTVAVGAIGTLRKVTLTSGNITGDGGAVLNNGTLTLTQCTVTGNTASGSGGAISSVAGSTLTLDRCTIAGNTAATAGGILAQGNVELNHCTVSANTGTGGTGGIIVQTQTTRLANTIVAGNLNAASKDIGGSGGTLTLDGANIIGVQDGAYSAELPIASPNVNGDFVGSAGTPVNAQLTALASNGGPTQTMAIGATSPARNAGGVPGSAPQQVTIKGTAGTFTLTFAGQPTPALAFNATAVQVRDALNALSTIGGVGGSTTVTLAAGVYTVTFGGTLANSTVTQLVATGTGGVATVVSNVGITDQRGLPVIATADSGAFEIQAGVFALSATTYKTLEGSPVTVTINRGTGNSGAVTVRLVTANGTATSPADFTARANAIESDVAFADGETSKNVVIATAPDTLVEGNHTFNVTLSLPMATSGATVGVPSTATVTIVDPIQVTNANDDGPGSLRVAVAGAAASSGPDVISFPVALNGKVITLGGEITVNDPAGLTIDASALVAGLTIDGGPGPNNIFNVEAGTPLTLRRLTLTGGNASAANGFDGGAIRNNGTLTLTQCSFTGNSATSEGGAIVNNIGATLTLAQCTFSSNTAGANGGAILNNGGGLTVTSSTFSGNEAGSTGGALHHNGGAVALTHCTLTGNTAGIEGGGIFKGSNDTTTLDRCIIAVNTATANPTRADTSSAFDINLVGANIIPQLFGTTSGTGTRLTTDPGLVALADNGGPTKTHAIQPNSPARDAGTGSAATIDQRGLPTTGVPDLGAFEMQAGGVFVIDQTTNPAGLTPAEGANAQVIVRRTGGGSGIATVQFTTTTGSATLGTDFTDATQLLNFADGEVAKTLNIPTAGADAAEGIESFNVALSTPSVGSSLGSPSNTKVFIIDPSAAPGGTDAANPVVTIVTAPAANASVNIELNGTVAVSGTATDNKGVASVQATLNGGGVVTLTRATPGAASTAFNGTLGGAIAGINTLVVTATDFAGRVSAPLTRTFKVLRPLLVNVSGNGSVTAGYAPGSFREIGQPQTITATPAAGAIFANWTILSSHTTTQLAIPASALEKPVLTFVHREGLALRASFVPNPYVASAIGTFNGAIRPNGALPDRTPLGSDAGEDGTASALSTEGYLTVTVQSTGAFSGSTKLDGITLSVAGIFDHTGVARFGTSRARTLSVARANKPSLSVTLQMDVAPPLTGKITGNVWQFEEGAIVAVSDVDADRAAYSATAPVPGTFLGTASADGKFTTLFVPDSGGSLGTTEFPQGRGYCSVTITKLGGVSYSGKLADDTALSGSTTLSAANTWRLFAPLYGNQGFIAGDAALDFSQGTSDFQAPDTVWVRPIQDTQHYSAGWPEGITVDTFGAKYTVTAGTSVLPGLPASDANGNANLSLESGALPTLVTKTVGISLADAVTNLPADTSFNLSINRATGVFSGTFTHVDGTRPFFTGMVYQKTNLGAGYFLTTTPIVKDYTGQSGLVRLVPQ